MVWRGVRSRGVTLYGVEGGHRRRGVRCIAGGVTITVCLQFFSTRHAHLTRSHSHMNRSMTLSSLTIHFFPTQRQSITLSFSNNLSLSSHHSFFLNPPSHHHALTFSNFFTLSSHTHLASISHQSRSHFNSSFFNHFSIIFHSHLQVTTL